MLLMPKLEKTPHIMVLGAGGTGSWLAEFLSKLDINANVTIFDGDIVEEKNTKRQRFLPQDVGEAKAYVVALDNRFAYVDGYIHSTQDLHDAHSDFEDDVLPIVVGCLDNNASRLIAHDYVKEVNDVIWVDAGNAERYGQVYVTIKRDGQIVEGFESPLDTDEAFQDFDGDERHPEAISCAEISESAPQHIVANVTSATTLLNVLINILNEGFLLSNKFVFDTYTVSTIPETKTADAVAD